MIRAVVLDLGNVVLEVDFRRTFRHWASSAEVDQEALHQRWALDQAYRDHETGQIDFETYAAALSERLGITMPLESWRAGWNDLFVGAFSAVQARLAALSGALPLYAFTNTNPTHEQEWRNRYPEALRHFDDIFVSSTMGMRKPDHAAFEWVTQAVAVAPEEILFVDDTLENVEGAARAGLTAEWVRSEADVLAALERF